MFSVSTFLYKGNAKQYTNDSQSSAIDNDVDENSNIFN